MGLTFGVVAAVVSFVVGSVVILLVQQMRTGLQDLANNQNELARDLTDKQNELARDLADTEHGLANRAQETFISLTNTQHELFRDLSGAQQGLQETLRNLQEIMHMMQMELDQSISKLHDLREALEVHRIQEKSKQRIVTLDAVAMREKDASEIWIVAVTIDYELADVYLDVIVKNLKQGKRYTYFFPGRRVAGNDVQKLVRSLERAGVSDDELRKGLRIYEVDEPNLLVNITIHDPHHGPKQGYLLPVLSKVDEGFQVRLDEPLYDRIAMRMFDWLDTARLEYPPEGRPDRPNGQRSPAR